MCYVVAIVRVFLYIREYMKGDAKQVKKRTNLNILRRPQWWKWTSVPMVVLGRSRSATHIHEDTTPSAVVGQLEIIACGPRNLTPYFANEIKYT